jgi:hypothetical protein
MIEVLMSVSFLSQRTGNWSKWGGGRMGLVSLFSYGEWWCQSCGEEQTKNCPSYMIPLDIMNRDFVKICSRCKNRYLIRKLKTLFDLKVSDGFELKTLGGDL